MKIWERMSKLGPGVCVRFGGRRGGGGGGGQQGIATFETEEKNTVRFQS